MFLTSFRWSRFNLGIQLGLAFGAVTLLFTLLLGIVTGQLAQAQIKRDVGQELQYLAHSMSRELDQVLFERYREIQVIAGLAPFRRPEASSSEQQALLETLQGSYPDYSWIGFTDQQGTVQASTQGLLQGQSVAERPWFQQGQIQPYLGDVHEAQLLAKLLPNSDSEPLRFVDVAAPVLSPSGELQGVLGAHLNWQWAEKLKESLLNSPHAQGKELFILSETGQVLLSPENWEETDLDLKSIALVQAQQSGYQVEPWPNASVYLTGYAQSLGNPDFPGLRWIILVRQQASTAFAPAYQLRQRILGSGVLLGIWTVALGWLIAVRVSKPMLKLAQVADQMRQGQRNIFIPNLLGTNEIARLAKALSQLGSDLAEREAKLKETNQKLQLQLNHSLKMERSLRRGEEQLRQVVENIDDALLLKAIHTGQTLYANISYKRISSSLAHNADQDSTGWLASVHAEDRSQIAQKFQAELAGKAFSSNEYRVVKSDGSIRWILDRSFPIRDETGQIYRYVVIKRDVTEQKHSEEVFRTLTERTAAALGKNFFSTLVQYLSEILEVEHVLITEQVGQQLETLAYWSNGKLQPTLIYPIKGNPCDRVLAEGSYICTEKIAEKFPQSPLLSRLGANAYFGLSLTNTSGQVLGHLCIATSQKLPRPERYSSLLHVFATRAAAELERQRLQEWLKYDAMHDVLTGLPNRNMLIERIELAFKRIQRYANFKFAVLFIDLDRFKAVNDSLGHAAGNQLLRVIAERLKEITRPLDLAARLGGDEFVLLLEEINSYQDAIQIAQRVLKAIRTPAVIEENEVAISASIGIAVGSSDYVDSSDLLRNADIAMYRAKDQGKDCYEIFNPTMHIRAIKQLQMENMLRQAIKQQEFSLRYQPIVNLATEQLVGFEALVRWEHPTRGIVSPTEFIPVAEETNLIVPLGKWILREACRQMVAWQTQFPFAASLKISVNLSVKQLREANLVQEIHQVLTSTGLPGRNLALEITESMLMQNVEAMGRLLQQLKDYEVQISIDDFGTGFSSLSYLHQLPANNLKVDRSFVSNLFKSPRNQKIAETVITLADQLDMNAIAEGIETPEQLEQLKAFGCELGQGYLFDAPLTVQAATEKIAGVLAAA